jgi:hypothetical protein
MISFHITVYCLMVTIKSFFTDKNSVKCMIADKVVHPYIHIYIYIYIYVVLLIFLDQKCYFRLLILLTMLYSSFSFFGHVNHTVGLSDHGYSKLRLVILIRSL